MSIERARQLRRDATKAERLLRFHLCGRRQDDLRFRFQHPIGKYVVDFCCSKASLVIEIDGGSHDDRYEYDTEREEWLKGEGFDILRYSNSDVLRNPGGVADGITLIAQDLIERRIFRMRSVSDPPKRID